MNREIKLASYFLKDVEGAPEPSPSESLVEESGVDLKDEKSSAESSLDRLIDEAEVAVQEPTSSLPHHESTMNIVNKYFNTGKKQKDIKKPDKVSTLNEDERKDDS